MVFGSVTIGGLTRLTESGLSIVNWDLLKGIKPPRNEDEWLLEFAKYKETPQFAYLESQQEMTLSQFKFIWSMEYFHRLWGRSIGLAFILPASFFWYKGWLSRAMKPRVVIFASLICAQGFLGWYMVKSGLKDTEGVPRVSHFRLASHLGMAFLLYSGLLWSSLTHLLPVQTSLNMVPKIKLLRVLTHNAMGLVFLTALSGALVAGLDAGLIYNTWPLMEGRLYPSELTEGKFFYNPASVQFLHRHLAEFSFCFIVGLWLASRGKLPIGHRSNLAMNSFAVMACVQAGLGISTLLMHAPVWLSAFHQNGSLVLLSFALWFGHEIRRQKLRTF